VMFVSCRSSRRRILNADQLVDALRSVAEVDAIEFSGKTFREQARRLFHILS